MPDAHASEVRGKKSTGQPPSAAYPVVHSKSKKRKASANKKGRVHLRMALW